MLYAVKRNITYCYLPVPSMTNWIFAYKLNFLLQIKTEKMFKCMLILAMVVLHSTYSAVCKR